MTSGIDAKTTTQTTTPATVRPIPSADPPAAGLAKAATIKLRNLLLEEPSVPEAPDALDLPPIEGEIRLEAVTFGYDQNEPVLRDVNLTIAPGETFSLVGPTGAGKSTIAKLVTRFYDPIEGRVLIDGHDLRDVTEHSLRSQLGIVPQEGFLFSGTIADNIRFGRPEATRAEVEAAARAVGADQVIAGLPDGYDTQVGERGALLAAGERQLVAFARAWIADPALLILDEATSNLDAASESRITDALQRLRSGRTTIIIAHRLSTIAQADQIAVVSDGRIVEAGTPAELRARGGRFADLFHRWVAGAA